MIVVFFGREGFFRLGLKVDLTGKSTLTEVGLEPQSGEPSTLAQPRRPHSATPSLVQPTREVPSVIKQRFPYFEPRDHPSPQIFKRIYLSGEEEKEGNKQTALPPIACRYIVLCKVAHSRRGVPTRFCWTGEGARERTEYITKTGNHTTLPPSIFLSSPLPRYTLRRPVGLALYFYFFLLISRSSGEGRKGSELQAEYGGFGEASYGNHRLPD